MDNSTKGYSFSIGTIQATVKMPDRDITNISVNPFTGTFYFSDPRSKPEYFSKEDLTFLGKIVDTFIAFKDKTDTSK